MAYFKVNDVDLSKYTASLVITNNHNYVAQTNAAGDTIVDYINAKRQIEVEIIPLEEKDFRTVLNALSFSPTVKYRNPTNGNLVSVNCIMGNNSIEYYTIRTKKVMYKKMKLVFTEL